MSANPHLSHRAVAASAAFLLSGFAFAGPAIADNDGKDGKGGKNGGDRGTAASQGRSQGGSKGGDSSRSGGAGKSGDAGKPSDAGKSGQSGKSGKSGSRGSQAKGDTGSTHDNGGDPSGNNGTFKVDGLPWSDGMANEPHVTCAFRLKFFGFDEGQTGDITIAGQAPSGSGVVSSKTGVLISDDAAGGGPNDPDAIVEYALSDLNLSGLTAHPKQGYHLKVTFTSDEGVKHKVFWLEPCATEGTGGTGTETGGTGTETGGTGTETGGTGGNVGGVVVRQPVGQVGGNRDTTAVLGTKFVRTGTAAGQVAGNLSGNAQVLGTRFERGAGALPFTGSAAGTLLALGGGLVVVGGGAWMLGRRMRHIA